MDSFLSGISEDQKVSSLQELLELYGEPVPAAIKKEIDHISDHYRQFIEKCPFVVVATSGANGLDCTPRGDPAGFVRIVDQKTVLIPDRRGNNRLDSLRNLVEDPRISLLFLIPGIETTLRINGTATIVTDVDLRKSFEINGKLPATVLVITINQIYHQCPKALVRSSIWNPEQYVERAELPSSGQIMQALDSSFDGKAYDEGYAEHMNRTIY